MQSAAVRIALIAALSFASPAFADADPIARGDIAHLKDLLSASDKRYEQLRAADALAIGAALAAQEKAIAAALAASKEAVGKAEVAAEKRFDAVNEFRSTLKDQQATFMTRSESEQRIAALSERVGLMQARLDKSEGAGAGAAGLWGYLIGAIGLALGLAGFYRMSLKQPERRSPHDA